MRLCKMRVHRSRWWVRVCSLMKYKSMVMDSSVYLLLGRSRSCAQLMVLLRVLCSFFTVEVIGRGEAICEKELGKSGGIMAVMFL